MTPSSPVFRVASTTASAAVLAITVGLFPGGPAAADSAEPTPASTTSPDQCLLVCWSGPTEDPERCRAHTDPETQRSRKSACSARGPCARASAAARTVGYGSGRDRSATRRPGRRTGRHRRGSVRCGHRHRICRFPAAHRRLKRTGLEHPRHQVRPGQPGGSRHPRPRSGFRRSGPPAHHRRRPVAGRRGCFLHLVGQEPVPPQGPLTCQIICPHHSCAPSIGIGFRAR
jgi:hypothetical protein